jgi:RNA polymerase sigma-70 factor, ECF subfamily
MRGYEEVYRQHLTAVFRYAQRVVGRRDVAEELTSDAFIALWRTFDTIDTSLLPGWLFTVVKNRAIDYWRKSGVEQKYLAGVETPAAVAGRPQHDFLDWLNSAPSLKPIHRAVLILRYVHGSERTEIAARLGLTEVQVKGHLQYAHKLLRKELSEAE